MKRKEVELTFRGKLAKGGRYLWVKIQRNEWAKVRPESGKGRMWVSVVSDGLRKEKWVSSALASHLTRFLAQAT